MLVVCQRGLETETIYILRHRRLNQIYLDGRDTKMQSQSGLAKNNQCEQLISCSHPSTLHLSPWPPSLPAISTPSPAPRSSSTPPMMTSTPTTSR
uniref:Tyrosine-protein phosphatase domain-containing protein n=1 Tax=Panagrellus redivivus TaxID=6233 RepID=A0A7E4VVK1_PANRE